MNIAAMGRVWERVEDSSGASLLVIGSWYGITVARGCWLATCLLEEPLKHILRMEGGRVIFTQIGPSHILLGSHIDCWNGDIMATRDKGNV